MTRLRITIARLMAIVLFLALGLGALRSNCQNNAKIAALSARIAQIEADGSRKQATLTTIIREMRDQLDRRGNALELPDGYVTAVDDTQSVVVLNIIRSQGACPEMRMAIYDAASLGIPNEKLKGTIMLTDVGEQSSTARLLETSSSIGPIRVGDIVYSPAWSPNTPTRFALVGKIDINRDGKDDRDELKHMIAEAGGIVDFDFPPPDVGNEIGTLSPRIDWYVTDDRPPFQDGRPPLQQGPLPKRMSAVIKEARLDGVRPMPIERLLAFLSYGMGRKDKP
jgi:hypothetical protein